MSRLFYEQRRRRQEEARRQREAESAGGTGSDLLNPLNPLSPVFVGADYSNDYSTASSDSGGGDSNSCSPD
ncbi:Uncharacterised protein [Serratia liquefaciens]|uniref:hypothetical protein n=1 Tax=Serratia liquefaciens TaxID=614 RepID=UPI0021795D0B|nr:hypothetical protein [Serratia liquefaciens]CAI1868959.1 Uncharacterised protein [Serratia liquefaciens]HDS8360228.1 hypothetical protein [Serratia liquefaciens]